MKNIPDTTPRSRNALPSRRRFLAGATAVILAGPAAPALAQAKERITIGFQPVVTGSLWVARGEGFFEKVGLEVNWLRFTSGVAQITALQGGQIQFGQGAPGAYFAGALNGADIAWASTFLDYNPLMGLVIRPESGIQKIADLKGKKIAVRIGTDGYFLLLRTLARNGLTAKQVEIVNLELPTQVAAMRAGNVDAAYTWDPFLTQMVGFGGQVVARGNDYGLGPAVVGWAGKASWLKANPTTALKALAALQMGYEAMQSRPELISKYAAHFTGIPAADAEAQAKLLSYFHPAAMADPRSAIHWAKGTPFWNVMAEWQEFAVDQKIIKQKGDFQSYVKPGLDLQAELLKK